MVNTAIDFGLFAVLHAPLGITLANFVSTAAGMIFSFVVNGLVTFKADRLTLRHALTFLGTTGVVLWVIQPIAIHLLLEVLPPHVVIDRVLFAKACTVVLSLGLNFLAYRFVVWREPERTASEA